MTNIFDEDNFEDFKEFEDYYQFTDENMEELDFDDEKKIFKKIDNLEDNV